MNKFDEKKFMEENRDLMDDLAKQEEAEKKKTALELAQETVHGIENHISVNISAFRMLELAREVVRLSEELEYHMSDCSGLTCGEAGDLNHACTMAEKYNEELRSQLETTRAALEEISKVTYGTELCNSNEENNSILAPRVFQYQRIAREALTKIGEK